MNASAVARALVRRPRAGPSFRKGKAGERSIQQCAWDARVESIRNILLHGGYTVTQLSTVTQRRYGARSPYFIPRTFLYKLRSGVTPHICQILALSESTGYCFVDWLRMCGFELQHVSRLQARLHTERTVLVPRVEDYLESFQPQSSSTFRLRSSLKQSSLTPSSITHGAAFSSCWSAGQSQDECSGRRYLFARIGSRDAPVSPQALPGSIVRVDRFYAHRIRSIDPASMDDLLWLVEHRGGLTCCHLRWIDDRQIVLLPNRPPWGIWPLHLPDEARILGLVDLQCRSLQNVKLPPRAGAIKLERAVPPYPREERMRFSDLLRISRQRTGLTFRAAQRLTRNVAHILGNRDYAISLGLLSDYEATGRLPRHIAKILSLCVVYCMDVRELLEAAGVHVDDSAKLPLPIFDEPLEQRFHLPDDIARHATNGTEASYAQSAGV